MLTCCCRNVEDPSNSLSRAPSLLNKDDAELQAKRTKLEKDYSDVEVAVSHVRPMLILKHTRRDSSASLPRSKRAKIQAEPPTRNGFVQVPQLATPDPESFEGRSAGLKRPLTPTALGRPPKRFKPMAKVKMS